MRQARYTKFGQQLVKQLLLILVLFCNPLNFANAESSFVLRSGYALVDPNASSSAVLGGEVKVDSGDALGLTATYMLSKNWGIGLLAATPFTHNIDHSIVGRVGKAKHLPPTITGQYFFPIHEARLKPYIGIGINYTNFFEEKTSGALEGTELELDDSFGVAFELGVDYAFNEQWGVALQFWHIDIESDATLKTGTGDLNFDVQIDPMVYMLGLSYRH